MRGAAGLNRGVDDGGARPRATIVARPVPPTGEPVVHSFLAVLVHRNAPAAPCAALYRVWVDGGDRTAHLLLDTRAG